MKVTPSFCFPFEIPDDPTASITYIGPNINGSHGKDGNNNGKVGYETTDPVGKETLGFEFLQMPGYQKGANE